MQCSFVFSQVWRTLKPLMENKVRNPSKPPVSKLRVCWNQFVHWLGPSVGQEPSGTHHCRLLRKVPRFTLNANCDDFHCNWFGEVLCVSQKFQWGLFQRGNTQFTPRQKFRLVILASFSCLLTILSALNWGNTAKRKQSEILLTNGRSFFLGRMPIANELTAVLLLTLIWSVKASGRTNPSLSSSSMISAVTLLQSKGVYSASSFVG